jgi:hypothetical protein
MFIWAWQISSYLCLTCNGNYTMWIGRDWSDETVNGGLSIRDLNKPKCIKNIEAIAKGGEPDYKLWV